MDRPCGEIERPADYTSDSLRRISPEAAARLAAPCTQSILCHLDYRPPPPPRRQAPQPPVRTDIPPPLPAKGDTVSNNHNGRRNLLHLKVPLPQKIGGRIATADMRHERTVTHVPIHMQRPNPSDPPQIPPRTRSSPQSPPRPLPSLAGGGSRAQNEYVDSPHTKKKRHSGEEITEQPELKKVSSNEDGHKDSIYCKKCGRCKCENCRNPKVSEQKEHMAKRVVDVCSCMCCVKGVFYHCCDEESGESDDPCACARQPHCCCRWTTMGVLSLLLPCLCLYWPLKGCVSLCQSCYRRCSVRGCRCHRDRDGDTMDTQRHLMEESSSST